MGSRDAHGEMPPCTLPWHPEPTFPTGAPPLRCDSSRVWGSLAVPASGSHLESLEIVAWFQEPPCGMPRRGIFNKLPK